MTAKTGKWIEAIVSYVVIFWLGNQFFATPGHPFSVKGSVAAVAFMIVATLVWRLWDKLGQHLFGKNDSNS